MTTAIYVYDAREQFQRPVFVVYDERHVHAFVKVLYDIEDVPDFLFISRVRMHPYEQDPYRTSKRK